VGQLCSGSYRKIESLPVDRQEQIEALLDHFRNPRNRQVIDPVDVTMPGGNPGCGDVVTIYFRATEDGGRLDAASFVGNGCTISQAAASVLMEMVNERRPPLEDILAMDYEDMVDHLGRETVNSRPRCATLALGTLKAAVRRYSRNRLRVEHGLPPEPGGEDEAEEFLV